MIIAVVIPYINPMLNTRKLKYAFLAIFVARFLCTIIYDNAPAFFHAKSPHDINSSTCAISSGLVKPNSTFPPRVRMQAVVKDNVSDHSSSLDIAFLSVPTHKRTDLRNIHFVKITGIIQDSKDKDTPAIYDLNCVYRI